jgi:molecular chaperone DnaK (HSP70)
LLRCEGAKRALSTGQAVPLTMKEAYIDNARPRDLQVNLDRTWVEGRWVPLFERVQTTILGLLQRAGWRPEDVGCVALIGGSALVPMFQRTVSAIFPGQEVVVSPFADVAVAKGAVLLTARHDATPRSVPVLDLAAGA